MDHYGVLRTGRHLLEEDIATHMLTVGYFGFYKQHARRVSFKFRPLYLNIASNLFLFLYLSVAAYNGFNFTFYKISTVDTA